MKTPISILLFALMFLAIVIQGGTLLARDTDLAAHITYGRVMIEQGGIPVVDPTVLGGGAPVLHEWLTEVMFALIEGAVGLGPILILAGLVPAGIAIHVFRSQLRHGFWPAFLMCLVAYAATSHAAAGRPHMFSWLFFYLLLVTRDRARWWPAVFAFGVLWVNMHVMVLLVPLVLGCELATSNRTTIGPRFAAFAASVVALVCNPWGVGLWTHIATFMSLPNPAVDCGPPDIGTTGTFWIYGALLLGFFACLVRPRHEPAMVLLLLVLAVAAGTSIRHLPYFGLALSVYAAPAFRVLLGRFSGDTLASEELQANPSRVLAAGVLMALFGSLLSKPQFQGGYVPPEAIRTAAAQGPGYTVPDMSGFLLYYGSGPTLIHTLNANVSDWEAIYAKWTIIHTGAPGWTELLDVHGVKWLVAIPNTRLWAVAKRDARWVEGASGDDWVLFYRVQSETVSAL